MNHPHLAKRAGAVALCAVLSTGILSAAAAPNKDVTAYLSPDISIVVEGSYRNFYSALGNETHPFLYSGTTYLPIRAIGELMGKNVTWDQATQTVSLSGVNSSGPAEGSPDLNARPHTIAAKVRPEVTITVDGTERTFTDSNGNVIYPMSYNGSVYLPVRNIGALMEKEVGWNNDTRTVSLGSAATNLISPETAKSLALAHAGLQSSQVTFLFAELEQEDGVQVYDVEFYTKDFKEYDYEIDAHTGAVLSFDYDAENNPPNTNPGTYIGQDKAKEIALAHAGLQSNQVTFLLAELEQEDGRWIYDVEFYSKDFKEYDYEIDAHTGAILSFDYDAEHNPPNTNPGTYIGQDKAKEITLAHAGLQSNQVTFLLAELEQEDGRWIYDVEFCTKDFKEYDYEIDAHTGAVLSFDYDAEHYQPDTNPGALITQAEAKRIALAQVPGAAGQNVHKVELDHDDGRMKYEVKIIYGTLEYEFEIDAVTGAILSRDVESIYD